MSLVIENRTPTRSNTWKARRRQPTPARAAGESGGV
jgi:hypothetical protein